MVVLSTKYMWHPSYLWQAGTQNDPHFGGCDHLRPRKWRVTEPNRDHLGSRKTLMIMIVMIMIIRMLVIMIVHLSMVVGIIMVIISMISYTVWLFNIAMEQDPSIDDLLVQWFGPYESPFSHGNAMVATRHAPWSRWLSRAWCRPSRNGTSDETTRGWWIGYSQYIWTCCVCVFIYIYIYIYVCIYIYVRIHT